MNAKQLKFLKQFASLSRLDVLTEEKELLNSVKGFLELDYNLALDVWEYLTIEKEGNIADDGKIGEIFGDKIYALFAKKDSRRAVKAVTEVPSIRNAAFKYSPNTAKGEFFDVAVDAAVANKIAICDEIFKCVAKNDAMGITFGQYMKALIERVFIEVLKKSSDKKIVLNKKMTALLLSHISKIKTDERPLLEQRMREIS